MNEFLTKSLAQIVNSNHRAATVFEKYHLDFCCKGKRSLEKACAEKQLKVEDVLSDLEKTNENSCSIPVNYDCFSLTVLADHIVAIHHNFVKKESPAILGYLQKVAFKHGGEHPEMLKVLELFTAVKEEMEHHMEKEESVLFPRIKKIEKIITAGREIIINSTYLLSPINLIEEEHDYAGSLMAEIRQLTNNYIPPADACTTYRLSYASLEAFELDLHQHIHLENNLLFPKAVKLFNAADSCSLN